MNTWVSLQLAPVLWLVLGIVMAVIEGVTVQLTAIWFALGAAAGAIAAVLGVPFMTQVYIFIGVSAFLLVFTRPFAKKVLHVKKVSTNADRVVGMIGIVTETVDNDAACGRVAVEGLSWAARAKDNQRIPTGERVKIIAIEGVKLIVEPN